MAHDEAGRSTEQEDTAEPDGRSSQKVGAGSTRHDSGTKVFARCHAVFRNDEGVAGHLPRSICPNFRKRTITEVENRRENRTRKALQQQKQKEP